MEKIVEEFKVKYIQVMDENGKVDEKLMPKLSDKQIKELYEIMILTRTFDDKAFNMQRQGRIGSYLQVKGQEAAQIGAVYALEDTDWMFPMYRSGGALLARKQPMNVMYQYWGGDERGLVSPKEVNNFPMAIPVGTQTAHAVGAGWAAKLKGTKEVSMGFMGDGATSKAEFHTGLNFAGVFGAPVVLVCENNQFAISVHREDQTGAKTIAQKAFAYGFEGIQVDGNDVFAVYKVAKEAVDKARAGKGPTFIEAFTYRMGDHSTSDDAKRYRDDKEVEAWAKKDPILRLEKFMKAKGLLDDSYKKTVAEDAKKKVEDAVAAYESIPPPNKEDIFTYMFETMPQQVQEQLEEFKEGY